MLGEIAPSKGVVNARQRWFADDFFELIVWFDDRGAPQSFQLCYDRGRAERAVTWTRTAGVRHDVVDSGEDSPLKNQTPVLTAGGDFDKRELLGRFREASVELPEPIRNLVEQGLEELAVG